MKSVFLGVIAAGVVYLVYTQFNKSKGKCGCSGASKATTPASGTGAASDTESAAIKSDAAVAPALAANGGDGFAKGTL